MLSLFLPARASFHEKPLLQSLLPLRTDERTLSIFENYVWHHRLLAPPAIPGGLGQDLELRHRVWQAGCGRCVTPLLQGSGSYQEEAVWSCRHGLCFCLLQSADPVPEERPLPC